MPLAPLIALPWMAGRPCSPAHLDHSPAHPGLQPGPGSHCCGQKTTFRSVERPGMAAEIPAGCVFASSEQHGSARMIDLFQLAEVVCL